MQPVTTVLKTLHWLIVIFINAKIMAKNTLNKAVRR